MTLWYEVHDSRVERPEEIDTTSSSTVVYERRNIRENEDGGWLYEQREYTVEEYQRDYALLVEMKKLMAQTAELQEKIK